MTGVSSYVVFSHCLLVLGAGRKQVSVPLEVFTSGTLYPPIGSHIKGQLLVSSLHKIYYEIFGNPNGMPVVCKCFMFPSLDAT